VSPYRTPSPRRGQSAGPIGVHTEPDLPPEQSGWFVRAFTDTFLNACVTKMSDRARFVLMILDASARTDPFCFPSNEWLQERTGKSERSLLEVLDELEGTWIHRVYTEAKRRERIGFIMLRRVDPAMPAADSPEAIERAEASLRAKVDGRQDRGNPQSQTGEIRSHRPGKSAVTRLRKSATEEDSLGRLKKLDDDGDSIASLTGKDGPVSIPIQFASGTFPEVACAAQGQLEETKATPPTAAVEELISRLSFVVDPVENVEALIPAWLLSLSKVTHGDEALASEWVLDAINRALALPKEETPRRGRIASYTYGCLSRWVSAGGRPHVELAEAKRRELAEAASNAAKLTSERAREAEVRKASEAEAARSKEAFLKARWDSLSEGRRAEINAKVRADNPGLGRFKNLLMPLCLAELERLTSATSDSVKAPQRSASLVATLSP
jgi:hypothetical protein